MATVLPIVDAFGPLAQFADVFPTASADVAADARRDAPELMRGGEWWIPVRSYLIESGGTRILVDTGLGGRPREFMSDTESTLPSRLEPERVDVVAFTHLHVDHIGWNGAFPNANYVVCEREWHWVLGRSDRARLNDSKLAPIDARTELVGSAHAIAPDVRLRPTHGHTPGHCAAVVQTPAGPVAIVGDVCVHPVQLRHPNLVYVWDVDPAEAVQTRVETLGWLADSRTFACFSHFPDEIGVVERDGDGFRWGVGITSDLSQ
jgi:glyoxylase-like metal-dependent hydrolase (beta-lactamase superfamily II)